MKPIDLGKISNEEITEFLANHDTMRPCCVCEGEMRRVAGEHETASLLLNPNSEDSPVSPSTFPLVVIACQNCGYLRLHALGAVARWKAARAA